MQQEDSLAESLSSFAFAYILFDSICFRIAFMHSHMQWLSNTLKQTEWIEYQIERTKEWKQMQALRRHMSLLQSKLKLCSFFDCNTKSIK